MAGTVFATTLQTLRKQRGVTQEQLASHLGVSPQAVSKWENGSYPDGDLLPQLADYFEVSIDYLYGREKEKVSLEQQLTDAIHGISAKENCGYDVHFEQILRYIWAMQIGFWSENKYYYERMRPDGGHVVASNVVEDAGFTFFRLNQSMEFYTVMKKPEGGYASYFKVTDELVRLFAFLGKKDNLKIFFYLLSLDAGEGVSVATIAKRIGVSEETAEQAMAYLKNIAVHDQGNKIIQEVSVLNEYDKREPLYVLNINSSFPALLLLAGADAVLNPPESFAFSVCGTEKAWFERDKLDFLQKTAKKKES